ncbi:aminotransferase [Propylenella binzhouense]|uniref:Aminotransferase n=1 Tax=Propylenella binzhouense TaxID=2555902 RepID=A0A964T7G4_9HYPH|nr:aminotransferase [Propylenella binzhouense]MYZ49903.1 aminotransferase [Propylenella binzhouense]
MKPTNSIYTGLPTTIFEEMSRLAMAHGAVNLGQGFPDTDGPEDVRRVAAEALLAGPNQYPPMLGLPDLRQAVAESWQRFQGLEVDWSREVLVTSGATEALSDAIDALVEPGDEVVLIEPLYDCYLPLVRRAGGVPRLVRITPPDWALDEAALRAAFSDRTKAVLLNNPHNPAAKVYREDELALLARLAIEHDAYVIADEVYEHIVFDGARHRSMLALPGMRERTVAIGSAGKSFSLTGWKVGYVTAAPDLLDPIAKAHQFTTFTTPPDLQKAVAYGLRKDAAYFGALASGLEAKRDRLAEACRGIGLEVIACQGTYFLTVDCARLGFEGDDAALARRMTAEAGVTAIPVSAFYGSDAPRSFLRFCFAKQDAVLDEAVERLARWIGTAERSAA